MTKPTQGEASHSTATINLGGAKTEVAAVMVAGKVLAMTATAASPRFDQAKVDARHIAKCWNCHDDLLAACAEQYAAIDALMQQLAALDPEFTPKEGPHWDAAQQAFEAMQKVSLL